MSEANLSGDDLYKTNLFMAKLERTNLCMAHVGGGANLSGANLTEANLEYASLPMANLQSSKLVGANLKCASFRWANLGRADLSTAKCLRSDFEEACLVGTNLERADLTGASIYGISAWDVRLEGAIQNDLVVTHCQLPVEGITVYSEGPVITVDDLEVAQLICLLLNNQRIRHVIDSITSKVVLILGRFTPERKAVLDSIREELRKSDYLPVLFDFPGPARQSTVETISTLAHMARFVIADLTDAKSVLQELQAIVPLSPSVIVQPLLLASQEVPGMFDFLRKFPWVLETHRYTDQRTLLAELQAKVIAPAKAGAKEQVGRE